MTQLAADDLVSHIVAQRGLGDPDLVGPRRASWWTGKAPEESAGWVRTDQGAHLTSMAQLDLASCTRQDVLNYFDNTWTLTEQLFASLQGESAFYLQNYHQLRHPLIFYYGHVAALYVNKMRVAGVLSAPIDAHFEAIFETGVDEMSWDDTQQSTTQWPAVAEVREYRRKVYQAVKEVIATHPGLADGHAAALADSPLWSLAMAFEHERIHLETSSVLMRELPQPLVRRPDGWVPDHPSVPAAEVFAPKEGVDYPANPMVSVAGGDVHLGKPSDYPSFGWDNEYGSSVRQVPAFAASTYKVSNGELLDFVTSGGYRERKYWSDEGWGWRTFRNAKWPTFWVSVGPSGSHQYRLRTVHDVVAMPWSWPAEINLHEAKAYCAWRAEREGARPYRLTTEGEHMRIREECEPPRPSGASADAALDGNAVMSKSGADFAAAGVNLNFAHGSPSPVDASQAPFGDAMGNVWEWCEDDFHPLDGFEAHPYYDDFSTPCFDGEHSMILGGSWAATGDEASAFARFHFRRHVFQHAGFRLAMSADAAPTRAVSGEAKPAAAVANVASGSGAVETTTPASPPPPSSSTAGGADASADGSGYESETLLNEYVMLHYGTAADLLPFKTAPAEWLHFPQRCAKLVDKWAKAAGVEKGRALDIGCAVGASSFELARTFDSVVGVDLSASFISAAQRMHSEGRLPYFRRDQGEIGTPRVAELSEALLATSEDGGTLISGDVDFQRADACALPMELGSFDACLLANLLCRLPSPTACLRSLSGPAGLVKPGGLAVIVSPYTWMEEHTPRSSWLGGYRDGDGGAVYSDKTLRRIMDDLGFSLLDEEDMPLLIREHERKYQFIISHAMVFQRRKE